MVDLDQTGKHDRTSVDERALFLRCNDKRRNVFVENVNPVSYGHRSKFVRSCSFTCSIWHCVEAPPMNATSRFNASDRSFATILRFTTAPYNPDCMNRETFAFHECHPEISSIFSRMS